jgi:hypothetical protein
VIIYDTVFAFIHTVCLIHDTITLVHIILTPDCSTTTIYARNTTMVQDHTTGNPLSAASLALFMATSLPKGEGPQLKNATEAVALAVHAGMIAVGFRLVGLGEDERIGKNPAPRLQDSYHFPVLS